MQPVRDCSTLLNTLSGSAVIYPADFQCSGVALVSPLLQPCLKPGNGRLNEGNEHYKYFMYAITKEVYFCYGHRLMNHPGKCRNLHGHSVKAAITITREQLDAQDMVCDFSDIKACVDDYVDRVLDHNFLLHRDDPIIPLLKQNNERFLVLQEHPTAEVLARMIFQHVQSSGFAVDQVVLWETASANACYRED